jgi:hypothetical protein
MAGAYPKGVLGAILQRLPILTHLLLIPLGIYGPTYLPRFFGLVLTMIHLAMLNLGIRYVYLQSEADKKSDAYSVLGLPGVACANNPALTLSKYTMPLLNTLPPSLSNQ